MWSLKIPGRRSISGQIKKLAKDKREDLKKIPVKTGHYRNHNRCLDLNQTKKSISR